MKKQQKKKKQQKTQKKENDDDHNGRRTTTTTTTTIPPTTYLEQVREGGDELSLHGGRGFVDFVGVVVVERVLEELPRVGQTLNHRIHEACVAQIAQTLQSRVLQRVATRGHGGRRRR